MICPKCGHELKSPIAVAGGSAGGRAKVPKGFASPSVMRKALRTRKRNAKRKEAEERKAKSGASPNPSLHRMAHGQEKESGI
jgi:hypothetical protein